MLERLDDLIRDPGRLTAEWRRLNRCDDDDAVVPYVGEPDEARLASFAERYRESLDVPFPRALRAVLARVNGLYIGCVESSDPDAGTVQRVSPETLSEPHLWPLSYGDAHMFSDVELDDAPDALLVPFAELADSGWFAFVATGESAEPVYWMDSAFSRVPPHPVAPSVEAFFAAYCVAFLCLPRVLAAARVPGWGG